MAIINLINGLFHTDFPLDSTVSYPNKEFVNQTLKDCFADVIVINISFGSQGTFDYKIQNYMYLEHDAAELNRQKMIVLIPFQLLKLRSLIQQLIPSGQEEIPSLTSEDTAS